MALLIGSTRPGSKYEGKSDKNGNFSITDIEAVLRFGVRKAGYYAVPGEIVQRLCVPV